MKKLIILSVTLSLILSNTNFGYAQSTTDVFKDTNTHWSKPYINSLVEKNIIKGYPDGTFRPDKELSYQEFTTMLVKAMKQEIDPNAVINAGSDWSKPYIEKAVTLKLTDGTPMPVFTRANTVDMLVKAFEQMETPPLIPNIDKYVSDIADYQTIPHLQRENVKKAYAYQLVSGSDGGNFNPSSTLTRAEGTTLIMKLIDPSLRTTPGNQGIGNVDNLKLIAVKVQDDVVSKPKKTYNQAFQMGGKAFVDLSFIEEQLRLETSTTENGNITIKTYQKTLGINADGTASYNGKTAVVGYKVLNDIPYIAISDVAKLFGYKGSFDSGFKTYTVVRPLFPIYHDYMYVLDFKFDKYWNDKSGQTVEMVVYYVKRTGYNYAHKFTYANRDQLMADGRFVMTDKNGKDISEYPHKDGTISQFYDIYNKTKLKQVETIKLAYFDGDWDTFWIFKNPLK